MNDLVRSCPQTIARGFTLVELMVTIAVAAILITVAVPSFQEIIKRNQVVAQNNELIALIHLARNEAIRRNPAGDETVLVELSANTTNATWEGAVFPPSATETAADCPDGAIRCASHSRMQLTSDNGFELYFDNRGYSVASDGATLEQFVLTLRHEDCSTNRHARKVTISITGQVSSIETGCS